MSVQDPADRIARRYRRDRPKGRVLLIALLVLVVLAVAWFGWALWVNLHPKVTSGLSTWQAQGENKVRVDYVVRLHADVTATCTVTAEDPNQQVLGRTTIKVTESGAARVVFATEREAARVEWGGCTAPGQSDAR
ncbi:MAG: DUF4307 domain-containing protein [Nocardioides sp.]|uniref:DUF4307 domain-containing protein n=1 Tax=Nocardioides sp. TaxID=35761 RepID=UPI0039E42AE1